MCARAKVSAVTPEVVTIEREKSGGEQEAKVILLPFF